jgi:hypothetical protein
MSSSESLELWSQNSNDNRDSALYANRHLNKSRTRTISSPHQPIINNRSDWMTNEIIPARHSSDSEVSNLVPSYIEILTNSGPDWLDSYDALQQQEEIIEDDKNLLHRRTFHHATSQQKQPVLVRKAKSLRDTNKSARLRSPPPPHISKEQPQLPDKLQFMSKVKRKFSLNSNQNPSVSSLKPQEEENMDLSREPTKTVSSTILCKSTPASMAMNSGLSEYQGYSRPTSKHRSFTYSPPPPRTSSLQAANIPAVPPMPPAPKIQELQSRSSSLKKKKSESFHSDKSEPIVQPIRSSSLRKKKSDNFDPETKRSLLRSRSSSLKKTKNDSSDLLTDKPIYNPPLPTANYTLNLSHDLAQIEQDIKALEIQRDRHSLFMNAAESQQKQQQPKQQNQLQNQQQQRHQQYQLPSTQTIGRKRGKVKG